MDNCEYSKHVPRSPAVVQVFPALILDHFSITVCDSIWSVTADNLDCPGNYQVGTGHIPLGMLLSAVYLVIILQFEVTNHTNVRALWKYVYL
jgi:hypothetical protein